MKNFRERTLFLIPLPEKSVNRYRSARDTKLERWGSGARADLERDFHFRFAIEPARMCVYMCAWRCMYVYTRGMLSFLDRASSALRKYIYCVYVHTWGNPRRMSLRERIGENCVNKICCNQNLSLNLDHDSQPFLEIKIFQRNCFSFTSAGKMLF